MNLKQWWIRRKLFAENRAKSEQINKEALREERIKKLREAKSSVEKILVDAGFKVISWQGVNHEALLENDIPCTELNVLTPDGQLAEASFNKAGCIVDISYKPRGK